MLGVFDLIGLTLWCTLPHSEVASFGVAAFLVVGVISILPVASLAWTPPSVVGLWLVLGGVLAHHLAVFQIPHPNFKRKLAFRVDGVVAAGIHSNVGDRSLVISCKAKLILGIGKIGPIAMDSTASKNKLGQQYCASNALWIFP